MQGGELQQKTLLVDGELPDEALNADTAEAFSREVWGQGFEEPIWMGDFKIVESRLVGKDQNHLKMVVERNGRRWNAMQFFCEEAPPNGEVSLAYRLGYNEFQGRRSADLMVVDRR
jgi:single-stranded-DNA-specific exonuclease